MNTIKTLNPISRCYGNCSDYRIGKMMGISRATVSRWRNNLEIMGEDAREMAADLLNESPAEHLMFRKIEQATRAKNTGRVAMWKKALSQISYTAGALLLAFGLSFQPSTAEASVNNNAVQSMYYAHIYSLFVIRWGIRISLI